MFFVSLGTLVVPTVIVHNLPLLGIMLLLICGMGAFAHLQFATMAQLNRFTNSNVLPGVAAGGRLDGEIADLRQAGFDVARLAYLTVGINANAGHIGKTLHDRHFLRKHGKKAYYGQKPANEK